MKIVGSEVTAFVYNAGGMLVAEYSTTIEAVETAQVSYLTQDHLGSPRVVTDKNGEVLSRKDYSAFGEELVADEHRSESEEYGGSEVRKGYTGYEKDSESGLEFAQARYYNTIHGRFTSVDPLTASASIRNPQTFNRYSYVLNSPYKYSDPLGLLSATTGACGSWCQGSGGGIGGGGGAFSAAINGGWDSGHRNGPQMLEAVRLEAKVLDAFSTAMWRQASERASEEMEDPVLLNTGPSRSLSGASTESATFDPTFMSLWLRHRQNPHDPVSDRHPNGKLLYENQCAIRLSITLLDSEYASEFASFFSGNWAKTKEGYLIRAQPMMKFLTRILGKPRLLTGDNRVGQVANKTGFLLLINFKGTIETERSFDHVDLWNRGVFGFGDYRWIDRAKKAYFWQFPRGPQEAAGRAP
ncbi:MAG: hypothetical protein IPM25_00340 [Chloracidobacterium sp.]|nr:hypothetical protein [Chloracidobacterium sp.]